MSLSIFPATITADDEVITKARAVLGDDGTVVIRDTKGATLRTFSGPWELIADNTWRIGDNATLVREKTKGCGCGGTRRESL